MDYPIAERQQAIAFTPAELNFVDYDHLVMRAKEVAEYINAIELTDDNIAEVKKTLADARKVTHGLDTARKDLKKIVMGNYPMIEEQIKHIISIVDDADLALRAKVKEMEEQEREEKLAAVKEVWAKRIGMYTFQNYISHPFDRWLKPQHLNKTTSMKSIETDMTEWMEQREKDINALMSFGTAYVAEYDNCLDITCTIQTTKDRLAREEKLNEIEAESPEDEVAYFVIRGRQNIKFAEIILKTNEIKFERK